MKPAPHIGFRQIDPLACRCVRDQNGHLDAFASRCQMVELHYLWRPNLQDEADNHVFELAVAAQNAPILTWNLRDFASAELRFPEVRVLTPAQWVALNKGA